MRLPFFLTLVYLVTADTVFDKYIDLKRSLKQASLPAKHVLPPSPPPQGVDHLTGKTEHDMKAAMLAKPSIHKPTKNIHKYASGHTFIPSVHTNHSWSLPQNNTNHTLQTQIPPHHKTVIPPHQSQSNQTLHQNLQSQEIIDALVGQGSRTGVNATVEVNVTKNVWSGSKAFPAVLLALLIWGCILISRHTGARRKARVLKKRLTMPRLVA